MGFLIISVAHGWQLVHHRNDPGNAAAAQFEAVLAKTLAVRRIDLICEESDPRHVSIAQKMAYEHGPRIPWVNINMSSQERLEAGIWEALLKRPVDHIEEAPGLLREIGHRIPEDHVREQFFCDKCLQTAVANAARNILVLCGDMHVESLSQKLRERNQQTETDHSLTPVQYWR